MLTSNEILTELTNITDSSNLNGPVIDGLNKLLTSSVYMNEINYVNTTLESSFNRSQLLNSRITHALDRNYSVYRGTNQKLIFNDLNIISDIKVNKFDLFGTYGNYKIVYAHDYNFKSGTDNNVSIECILCTDVYVRNITIESNNRFMNDIADNNISESIDIFYNGERIPYRDKLMNIADLPLSYTLVKDEDEMIKVGVTYKFYLTYNGNLYFKHRTGTNINNYILVSTGNYTYNDHLIVQTMSGYGVTIFNKNTSGPLAFKVGDLLTVKYIKYLDEQIDPDVITSVPGYETNAINVESIDAISPDYDIDHIYLSATTGFISSFVIRSNSDLDYLVKSYFSDYMLGMNLVKIQTISPMASLTRPRTIDGGKLFYKIKLSVQVKDSDTEEYVDYVSDNVSLFSTKFNKEDSYVDADYLEIDTMNLNNMYYQIKNYNEDTELVEVTDEGSIYPVRYMITEKDSTDETYKERFIEFPTDGIDQLSYTSSIIIKLDDVITDRISSVMSKLNKEYRINLDYKAYNDEYNNIEDSNEDAEEYTDTTDYKDNSLLGIYVYYTRKGSMEINTEVVNNFLNHISVAYYINNANFFIQESPTIDKKSTDWNQLYLNSYDPNLLYDKGDLVLSSDDSSQIYMSLTDNNQSNDLNDTDTWKLIDTTIYISGTTYTKSEDPVIVQYNGYFYQLISESTDVSPENTYELDIDIVVNSQITTLPNVSNSVNKVLDIYERKIGDKLNLWELLADLQEINGVQYIKTNNPEKFKIIDLEDKYHIEFNRESINYETYLIKVK